MEVELFVSTWDDGRYFVEILQRPAIEQDKVLYCTPLYTTERGAFRKARQTCEVRGYKEIE
jgi:hypothetical protein